ncbi:MAG: hypothetical protein Q7S31_03495 [bacterium]|nr:hypothetical protein [bacterium]
MNYQDMTPLNKNGAGVLENWERRKESVADSLDGSPAPVNLSDQSDKLL